MGQNKIKQSIPCGTYWIKVFYNLIPKLLQASRAIIELQRYLEDEVLSRNKNPLEWWRKNEHNCPYLSPLIRARCCALATSVPCERLFSKARNILNERRTRLPSTSGLQSTSIQETLQGSDSNDSLPLIEEVNKKKPKRPKSDSEGTDDSIESVQYAESDDSPFNPDLSDDPEPEEEVKKSAFFVETKSVGN
ncbi:unnamed protein product [Psylliodes chrysocephalus]|uniref:HAT C-terminal dimerisation domain-containing protein n=1 Tax=Psylliodes chrysocephalus TaxID=3402493 RepID=A0A9P0CW29_9CUCU|nr:unnamed protein product [Psylliodes chrysocephala]